MSFINSSNHEMGTDANDAGRRSGCVAEFEESGHFLSGNPLQGSVPPEEYDVQRQGAVNAAYDHHELSGVP